MCTYSGWGEARRTGSSGAVRGRSDWTDGTVWGSVCSARKGEVMFEPDDSRFSFPETVQTVSLCCSFRMRLYCVRLILVRIRKSRWDDDFLFKSSFCFWHKMVNLEVECLCFYTFLILLSFCLKIIILNKWSKHTLSSSYVHCLAKKRSHTLNISLDRL